MGESRKYGERAMKTAVREREGEKSREGEEMMGDSGEGQQGLSGESGGASTFSYVSQERTSKPACPIS